MSIIGKTIVAKTEIKEEQIELKVLDKILSSSFTRYLCECKKGQIKIISPFDILYVSDQD